MNTIKNKFIKKSILIIGNPHTHPSTHSFLFKFVRIISSIVEKLYVVSGDEPPYFSNVVWKKTHYCSKRSVFCKIFNFLSVQFLVIFRLWKFLKEVDQVIILPTTLFCPIIVFKLLGKKTMIFAAQKNENRLAELFSRLSFFFSDLIIVESNCVIYDLKIGKYKEKIVQGNIFVDTNFFKIEKKIADRSKVVGYIGLLIERKGTNHLIQAISSLSKNLYDIEFIIGGTGIFEKDLRNLSSKYSNIKFNGIVPQSDLPAYFNQMKLFVLPSISEGVPNVLLEAMACGTPVLATPVGGIPDILFDGETGFIMDNNTSKDIEQNIIRALEYENLDRISKNALETIKAEYTLEAAVKRYRDILSKD